MGKKNQYSKKEEKQNQELTTENNKLKNTNEDLTKKLHYPITDTEVQINMLMTSLKPKILDLEEKNKILNEKIKNLETEIQKNSTNKV